MLCFNVRISLSFLEEIIQIEFNQQGFEKHVQYLSLNSTLSMTKKIEGLT